MAVQQRMIRSGPWKLIFYNGYRPQLFNLADDPRELDDLAGKQAQRATRERLERALLADWDPDAIAARMRARRLDKDVIGAWARATRPEDRHRWKLTAEQNWIDGRAAE